MSSRTNTAIWNNKRNMWKIDVQKDKIRKSFYSSKPGRTGQREANKKADEWLNTGIISNKLKIRDLYKTFSDEMQASSSTSAMNHIEQYGRLWIVPYLGKIKPNSLRDIDIEKMLEAMAKKELSKKTIQNARGILSKFLKWCRKNSYTTYRLDDVTVPTNTRLKGKKVLQPKDIAILLSSDKTWQKNREVFEPLIYAFRFAVFTGLRPGELRALKQCDIVGNTVYVQGAVNVYQEETKGKNQNSIRSFVMSQQALEALQAQLSLCPDSEYIFDLPPHSTHYHRWQAYSKYNNITPISLYEMRHTFVSVVKTLNAGEIKTIVGHSKDMDTFGIYSHFLEGEDVKTAEKITELFKQIEELKHK